MKQDLSSACYSVLHLARTWFPVSSNLAPWLPNNSNSAPWPLHSEPAIDLGSEFSRPLYKIVPGQSPSSEKCLGQNESPTTAVFCIHSSVPLECFSTEVSDVARNLCVSKLDLLPPCIESEPGRMLRLPVPPSLKSLSSLSLWVSTLISGPLCSQRIHFSLFLLL